MMQQPGEPSVEEILDSIKKVIARDNRDGLIAERRRRTADTFTSDSPSAPDETTDNGVLELAEEEIFELHQHEEYTVADDAAGTSSGEGDALIRDDTREAMRQNFAALSMLATPGKQPQIVRSGETSLEGLTRELLRPMLAQWLDENLPGMVEELVKAEISRIAGKRG